MASQLPPLLEPYLQLAADGSFVLLTSTLSASTNWLVLRYLQRLLAKGAECGGAGVLLASYMRDRAFWRDGARKLGLDLEKLAAQRRFAFVDGLTSLFLPATSGKASSSSRPADLARIHDDIMSSIRSVQDTDARYKPVLVIDGVDLILAASTTADPVSLSSTILGLCEHVHTTILCLACDEPFVHQQRTPLEINQASFLLNMAHIADLVISLRGLGTGCARDVSGILRISRMRRVGVDMNEVRKENEGRELLYHVSGDGGVRVFERGE